MHGRFETYVRPHRGFAAAPTHDGLTVVVAGWPYAEFAAQQAGRRRQLPRDARRAYPSSPSACAARRETRLAGAPTPNFFARPYGPGWALVGDAGYLKDPITAQGIRTRSAMRELCAGALDAWLSDALPSMRR